ncbi:MAG TPA: CDP-alcohol phosphatidyltransferase family protein [Rhodothermales bacterium]|nr:CDP-alcohol phosphatidyltransferase family protein [Rhodothermales bacterium]
MPERENAHKEPITAQLGKFWTAANMLSIARLILIVPITLLILERGSLALLFTLVLLAITTDFFDGRIARWSHTVSSWGKVLDPLADKAAAAMITLALVARGSLPEWFLGVIVVRDSAIVLGGVALARRTSMIGASIWWGKVAVTALAVTVLAALLEADPPILRASIWITTGLMIFSFTLYAIRFLRLYRYRPATTHLGPGDDDSSARVTAEHHTEQVH